VGEDDRVDVLGIDAGGPQSLAEKELGDFSPL